MSWIDSVLAPQSLPPTEVVGHAAIDTSVLESSSKQTTDSW